VNAVAPLPPVATKMRKPFDQKYVPVPESGCWLWTSGWDSDGYGLAANNVKAHRLSFELHTGPIPKGFFVCHRCDTPACVNPEHLFLGTPLDNSRDMAEKGRSVKGQKQTNSKLTEADVRRIVASTEPSASLCKRLGVSSCLIRHIRNGRAWRHITGLDSRTRASRRAKR
jgi:hypothetical protein